MQWFYKLIHTFAIYNHAHFIMSHPSPPHTHLLVQLHLDWSHHTHFLVQLHLLTKSHPPTNRTLLTVCIGSIDHTTPNFFVQPHPLYSPNHSLVRLSPLDHPSCPGLCEGHGWSSWPLADSSSSLDQIETWMTAQHLKKKRVIESHLNGEWLWYWIERTVDDTDNTPQSKDDDQRSSFECFFLNTAETNHKLSIIHWKKKIPKCMIYMHNVHTQFAYTVAMWYAYIEATSKIHEITTMVPSKTSNLWVKYFIRNAIIFSTI